MNSEIYIEKFLDAEIGRVWRAITDKDQMKAWYFDLSDFKPEVGFTFEFLGKTDEGVAYNHICKITEVEMERKLTYSWQYEGFEGLSYVTFLLSEVDERTRLQFSHQGLSSFPASNPDFAVHNFQGGWHYFIDQALPQFLNNQK